MILLTECQKNREEWLRLRKGKIGASQAYDAANIDAESQPFKVWQELTGTGDERDDNEWAFWGRTLEKSVFDGFILQYKKEHPERKVELLDSDFLIQHPSFDWAVATPDFVVSIDGEPVIVQVKTRSPSRYAEYKEGIPNQDRAQVLHELGCMSGLGVNRAILAVFFYPSVGAMYRPPTLEHFEILREPEFIDELFRREEELVLLARRGELPEIKLTSSKDELKARYFKPGKDSVDLSGDPNALAAYNLYLEGSEKEKLGKSQKDAAGKTLMGLIGDAKEGFIAPGKLVKMIRVAESTGKEIDTKALKKADPSGFQLLVDQYPKTVASKMYVKVSGESTDSD